MNIPTLRFKRFSEELKALKMKDFLSIGSGRDYKHLRSGDVPVYGTGGLLTMVDDFLYEGETVCIGRKGTIDKPLFHKGKIWTVDTLFYTHSFKNIYPHFVYLLFQRVNWKQHNEAGGVPSLAKSTIENIQFNIPSLEEQKKVSRFFSVIDKKLDSLKKKKELLEQYKKGVMQKIFSQELRFKDEEGNDFPEWEEKELGEVAVRVTLKNKENNTNVLTISAQLGLISQLEYYNKSVSSSNITNYYLLHEGDFAYNKSYSNGYPMGAIKRLKKYESGVVSTLYICFRFKEGLNPAFYEHYFESGLHNNQIQLVAQEGARNHGLLNIGVNDFFGTSVPLPILNEQQKIADFLSALDDKIALVEQQINQTELWKKGLLQKMFV